MWAPVIALAVVMTVVVVARPSNSDPGSAAAEPAGPAADTDPVTECEGPQVPELDSSPPCMEFSGDNGGATYQGVTGDSVKVVEIRAEENPQVSALLQQAGVIESPGDSVEFTEKAIEFLNEKYQLYGRTIELVQFDSECPLTPLDFDRCRASVQEVVDMEPFAILWPASGYPEVFDEFTRAGILTIGGDSLPASWYSDDAPLRWNVSMDADTNIEGVADFYCKKLAGKPADHTGVEIHSSIGARGEVTRKLGVVMVEGDNQSVQAEKLYTELAKCGEPEPPTFTYDPDITRAAETANALVTGMISEGVTTMICLCDPVAPVFNLPVMTAQGWFPEHVLPGVGLLDADPVARLYDPAQWAHAFGPSMIPNATDLDESDAQTVWSEMGGEGPVCGTCDARWPFYSLLGSMLQLAGPDLTPANVEVGLFTRDGSDTAPGDPTQPVVSFAPGKYNALSDHREVWWDPDLVSARDDGVGAYVAVNDGIRTPVGQFDETLDVPVAPR